MIKFIFFGTGGLLSSICLSELIKNGFIPKQVILQAQESCVYPNLTELCAQSAQISVQQVEDVNSPDNIRFINSIGADFGVIASFGQIFKKELLSCFPIYNVHMGVLPEYRGAYTNFWKILANHNRFGATIHMIDELVDGGKALLIVEEDFSDVVFANSFFRKNYEMAAQGLIVVMQQLKQGNIKSWDINISNGKYYPKHTYEDLILNPEEDVKSLHVKINRLQFYGNPIISGFEISESNLLLVSNINDNKYTIRQVSDNSYILQNKTGVLLLKGMNKEKN